MFMEALDASDWETIKHNGMEFTFSCMKRSIICMEVRRDGKCIWDNPGPMMPGQIPEMMTQGVFDKLNKRLAKLYGANPGWRYDASKHRKKTTAPK